MCAYLSVPGGQVLRGGVYLVLVHITRTTDMTRGYKHLLFVISSLLVLVVFFVLLFMSLTPTICPPCVGISSLPLPAFPASGVSWLACYNLQLYWPTLLQTGYKYCKYVMTSQSIHQQASHRGWEGIWLPQALEVGNYQELLFLYVDITLFVVFSVSTLHKTLSVQ